MSASEPIVKVEGDVKAETFSVTVENLGTSLGMEVTPTMTVAQLCQAYFALTQKELPFVTLDHRRLSGYATLRDSGVMSGSLLIGAFELTVHDKDFAREATLIVGPDDTMAAVSRRFVERFQRPILASTGFFFRGAKLENDKTLAELQVRHSDSIEVSTRGFDVSLTYQGRREALSVNRAMTLRQLHAQVRARFDLAEFTLATEQGAIIEPSEVLIDNTQLRPNTAIIVTPRTGEAVQRLNYICHGCSQVVRSTIYSSTVLQCDYHFVLPYHGLFIHLTLIRLIFLA